MSDTSNYRRIGSAPYPQYVPPAQDLAGREIILPGGPRNMGSMQRIGVPQLPVINAPLPPAAVDAQFAGGNGPTTVGSGADAPPPAVMNAPQQQPSLPPIDPQLYLPASVPGGRVPVRPSEDAASDARAALAAIVARMSGEGANQMIGYRVAADLAAQDAAARYDANVGQHNETVSADASQEALRHMTETALQRQNGLTAAAINNPAGAAAAARGTPAFNLIDPAARQRYNEALAARTAEDLARANHYNNQAAGGGTNGATTRQTQRLTDQQQRAVNAEHTKLDAEERTTRERFTRIEEQYRNNPTTFGATPAQQQQRLAEIRARMQENMEAIQEQRGRLPPRAFNLLPDVSGGAAVPQPRTGSTTQRADTAAANAAPRVVRQRIQNGYVYEEMSDGTVRGIGRAPQ